ncbi:Molybdenum cofactor sulfurase [Wickerhamiella sorbophila]|uniref:Molybdenum cofactor sulfurase n=1 Tax=Wickerhamiella sorbophila TaxID=45607 RepID=A0A2T0FMW8_9ASCO|nr:Molybdenum cofactor sulfurase [Wickerhamiella sorbophila]PRT56315.1 Molybdenum cofactor sulfurase [Wickerhamiella sorbophila]
MRDYAAHLGEIRESEYPAAKGYLDNAASPLYAKSIVMESAKTLIENPLVNPHSHSRWGTETANMVGSVRKKVLALFNASEKDYAIVFTSNATAAAKLVGECLRNSHYAFLRDSHTSLVGLRSLAASYEVLDEIGRRNYENTVVSFPLQSNFDGQRYPEDWIKHIAHGGGLSLVDLAAYCATTIPDLSEIKPDFAVLSFYKIFGLPDLGALIVKRGAATHELLSQRRYFGGGTVAVVTAEKNFMIRSIDISTSLEDGTLPFHSILMLGVAIKEFKRIFGSFEAISNHTQKIALYCRDQLNKTGLVDIISPKNSGPVVTFTLKHGGYRDLELILSEFKVQLRTGTLCNIGAFVKHSEFTEEDLIRNHIQYGKTCNDGHDILDGHHTGVVRASFGPYTSTEDVDMLAKCIVEFFSEGELLQRPIPCSYGTVTELVIYPIKSCAGTKVSETIITSAGLKWDREFCLVGLEDGKILRLKRFPKMALLRSRVDEGERKLHIQFQNKHATVALDVVHWSDHENADGESCSKTSDLIWNHDPELIRFLSSAIGTSCTLAKAAPSERFAKENKEQALANSSPLLFVSQSSSHELGINHDVFRGNIIFTAPAFAEDSWRGVTINGSPYSFSSPCQRCNMICFTPDGSSDATPYLILTKHRKTHGKIYFGQLGELLKRDGTAIVKVGDALNPILPI